MEMVFHKVKIKLWIGVPKQPNKDLLPLNTLSEMPMLTPIF